jgi:hypothetical protein
MTDLELFVTDFGTTKIGPKVREYMNTFRADLALSKRTKRYKAARCQMDRLERCICTLAEIEFVLNGDLETTP